MSDPNLLKRLAKGKTQNSNESLHSVICSRCSKTVFVSHRKLQGAVARAVASFNAGASHLTEVMEFLAIEVNELNLAFVDECDRQRVAKAELARNCSCSSFFKHLAIMLQLLWLPCYGLMIMRSHSSNQLFSEHYRILNGSFASQIEMRSTLMSISASRGIHSPQF